ncbi:MAG: DUF1080 domain-containing protein [Pirellulales bacterium]
MKHSSCILIWILGSIVLLISDMALADEKKSESGFVSMYNGKNLEGWTVMPAKAAKEWTVVDGMIVGTGVKGRSYLVYHQKDIADFEIKLDYRFPGQGNSGISIRACLDETHSRLFQCYHADFGHLGIGKRVLGAWDFHTPGRQEHACFRGDRLVIDENDKPTVTNLEGALTTSDIHQSDWNHVYVTAKGNQFKFFINDKPASEFTEHLQQDRRLNQGMIQLQLHDPGMVVQFRKLEIKILR